MQRNMSTYRIFFALLILVGVGVAPFVKAADYTSSNFLLRDSSPEEIGGSSTSTSFSSVFSGSDIAQTEASSTNFLLNSGPMFFETFVVRSQNWQWYDDAENETPIIALEGENVAPVNLQSQNVIALRVTVAEIANISAGSVKLRLQFATSSDFSGGGTFVSEEDSCSPSSSWCYGTGGGVDNAVISTGLLTDSESCASSLGNGCGTHNESGTSTSSFTHVASTTKEYEFTIQSYGASLNTVYFFRLLDTGGNVVVPTNTGSTYPSNSVDHKTERRA